MKVDPPPAAKVDAGEMQRQVIRSLAIRLGLPILAVWMLAAFANRWWGYALAGVLTALAAAVVGWGWQRTVRTRKVADILQSVDPSSKEGRKAALEKLEAAGLGGDVGATLARAQLTMQDDPDKALRELETVDLGKVLPAEADQIRFQRAMIHLLRGETDRARQLVDLIDLSRHEEAKARAIMAAVIAEAWARTGQARKGKTLLEPYKVDDPAYAELRPQMLRAQAFASAALNDTKEMRKVLKRLASDNPQYLMAFLQKKVHPLLTQEARMILMQSGAMPQPRQRVRYR